MEMLLLANPATLLSSVLIPSFWVSCLWWTQWHLFCSIIGMNEVSRVHKVHPTRLSTYEVCSIFTSAFLGQKSEISGKVGVASLPQTSNHLSFLTCPFSLVFMTVRSLPQLSWDTLAYKEYGRSSSKVHFSPHLGPTHLCTITSISF